jgi:hypothetical protein
LSGEEFPVSFSERFHQLERGLATTLNNSNYRPYPVSITVSDDLSTLKVRYDYPNSYYPSEKIEATLSQFYEAEFVNIYDDKEPKTYWSGPWRITFDPQRYGDTKSESHWTAISVISRPFRAEIYEGTNEQGEKRLRLRVTVFQKDVPTQDIWVVFKNGKPQLLRVIWYSLSLDEQALAPDDWWGKEMQQYADDLPPEIHQYLTPEVVGQIAAEAKKTGTNAKTID